jgi:hypothetical protein
VKYIVYLYRTLINKNINSMSHSSELFHQQREEELLHEEASYWKYAEENFYGPDPDSLTNEDDQKWVTSPLPPCEAQLKQEAIEKKIAAEKAKKEFDEKVKFYSDALGKALLEKKVTVTHHSGLEITTFEDWVLIGQKEDKSLNVYKNGKFIISF